MIYEITREDGKLFEVRKIWGDKYRIIEVNELTMGEPLLLEDGILLWGTPPVFDSFIQAVRYLKENLQNLL